MSPRLLIAILLVLAGLLIGGPAVSARPAAPEPGRVDAPLPPPGAFTAVPIQEQLYVVDLPRLGVHPLPAPVSPRPVPASPFDLSRRLTPDSGAVGIGGAYMNVSPEVISQSISAGFGAVSANWLPSEQVAVSMNGGPPTNYTASATGRLGQIFNVGAGLGYITLQAWGRTSGRQTGGVVNVRDAAPPVPGLAIAPHAINPNGASNINVLGTRYTPGSVTLARNGTAINTLTAGSNGSFYYQINVAAGSDTAAIYTSYTTTVGSEVGQSIEERADAGVPPTGDQNVARGFADRSVVNSSGGTVALVGEGFAAGESVNVTNCGTASYTADNNGAIRFFNGVSGSGNFLCILTGGTTGRIARIAGRASSNVTNVPGIIAAPAEVSGGGTFTLIIARLLPSQSGTVYLDNVSQGTLSTDSGGKAAALLNKPSSGFLHVVQWVGTSGQNVIAPLLYLPGAGTPTATRTPTNTPTRTPVPPTPTNSPTNTPVTGSTTPTNSPTNTPVIDTPTPTATTTPANTATATSTACVVNFSDVGTGDYFYGPVQYLACHGVIGGYSDGTFRPYNNTTRGQMSKIVVLAYNLPIQTPAVGDDSFADVPSGSTFYPYAETALAGGIVSGYACGGTNPETGAAEPCDTMSRPYYRPGNQVTRGQLSKIVVGAAVGVRGWTLVNPPTATFGDVPVGSTFYQYIETAVCHGMINGYSDGTFRPAANATRGQIGKIVYFALGSGVGCGPPATPLAAHP